MRLNAGMSEEAKVKRSTGMPLWGALGWAAVLFGLIGALNNAPNLLPIVLGVGGAVVGTGGLLVAEMRRPRP